MRPEAPKLLEAHGYDIIEHQIVWHVIQNELAGLVKVVEGLLASADDTNEGP